jgi:hypothetical protein
MTQRHTCEQLGVCQCSTPSCTDCDLEQTLQKAIEHAKADSMTPLDMTEELFAWAVIALCTCLGVMVVMFIAGYWAGGAP